MGYRKGTDIGISHVKWIFRCLRNVRVSIRRALGTVLAKTWSWDGGLIVTQRIAKGLILQLRELRYFHTCETYSTIKVRVAVRLIQLCTLHRMSCVVQAAPVSVLCCDDCAFGYW